VTSILSSCGVSIAVVRVNVHMMLSGFEVFDFDLGSMF
jgi:hypothetical protein